MISQAAPGWYPDSTTPDRLRWWDGDKWTEHYSQASQPPPPGPGLPQAEKRGWSRRRKLLVFGVGGFVALMAIAAATADPDDSTTDGSSAAAVDVENETDAAEAEPLESTSTTVEQDTAIEEEATELADGEYVGPDGEVFSVDLNDPAVPSTTFSFPINASSEPACEDEPVAEEISALSMSIFNSLGETISDLGSLDRYARWVDGRCILSGGQFFASMDDFTADLVLVVGGEEIPTTAAEFFAGSGPNPDTIYEIDVESLASSQSAPEPGNAADCPFEVLDPFTCSDVYDATATYMTGVPGYEQLTDAGVELQATTVCLAAQGDEPMTYDPDASAHIPGLADLLIGSYCDGDRSMLVPAS